MTFILKVGGNSGRGRLKPAPPLKKNPSDFLKAICNFKSRQATQSDKKCCNNRFVAFIDNSLFHDLAVIMTSNCLQDEKRRKVKKLDD